MIDGSHVAPGDALIALPSSGPHSNGYSLIRKIIDVTDASLDTVLADGQVLVDALLAPTTIYNKVLLGMQREVRIHAMAHITGGGLPENLPRVLPEGCSARIDLNSWTPAAVFQWLQAGGNVTEAEMLRTFNCGVGMVLVVADSKADLALEYLHGQDIVGWRIGEITGGNSGIDFIR